MARAEISDAAIGARVRELRQKIGLSAVDLARALGVTVSAIKELESGRATRQWVQLRALAGILGTTSNMILGEILESHVDANDEGESEVVMQNAAYSSEQIGRRVAEQRKVRGMSRNDLALAIGLAGESSVSEIENGRNNKKYVQLAEMAEALGTTPNHLLGFDALPSADDLDTSEEVRRLRDEITKLKAAIHVLMGD